ncbi:unnamed protein product [Symbiodinium sp. CCMP2592]|nr:unnamed protein product [Symbiodinium sp. CCMP2592]
MPTPWGFRADQGRMPVFHFESVSGAASTASATGGRAAWTNWSGASARGLLG